VALRLPDTRALPTELLWNLTLRELRGRFKRSTLGWLWSIINPLASIAIYTLVFGVFLKVDPPVGDPSGLDVYGFFLVCGLLPWTFLTNGLNGAASSIVGNEGLVKKVYFPRSVLPAASTLAWLANFGVELAVLGVVLLVAGNMVLTWIPVVVALMVIETGFVLGLGLLLSAANAYFRDVQHFLAIALNIWFYATPILYPPETIPEDTELFGMAARDLLGFNPMAVFVDSYRSVLYDLAWPTAGQWVAMIAVAAVSLVLGAAAFRRLEPRLAEEL
jgi:ABC-type polysaccharide/polyol phosphate export permease